MQAEKIKEREPEEETREERAMNEKKGKSRERQS